MVGYIDYPYDLLYTVTYIIVTVIYIASKLTGKNGLNYFTRGYALLDCIDLQVEFMQPMIGMVFFTSL